MEGLVFPDPSAMMAVTESQKNSLQGLQHFLDAEHSRTMPLSVSAFSILSL